MKRNHLIPREKSKKVIYLDPRGRGVGEKHYGARALYVLAVLCLLYCVGIGLFVAFGSYFFLVWGVIGAFCAAWAWVLNPSAKPRECKDIWKPPGSIRSGSSWRMLPRIPRRI